LPGDSNRDGEVDASDYDVWESKFGSTTELKADHNKNGVVDAADYVVWRDNLGRSVTAVGSVVIPEPPAAQLILLALAAFLTFRRR
jgi:hypothetical protein